VRSGESGRGSCSSAGRRSSTSLRACATAATAKCAASRNQNGFAIVESRMNCTLLSAGTIAVRCSSSMKLLLLTAGMHSAVSATTSGMKRRVASMTTSPSTPNAITCPSVPAKNRRSTSALAIS
jgi:hypothetical protein